MKDMLYRKIFKALNEDLNMILSDDDFEEPEIDLGVHLQNIRTKCSPQYVIQEAINNDDPEQLRKFINNCWDGETAFYPVNNDNIKDVVKFSVQALGNSANLNWIDTSNVTNMSRTFEGSQFNGDISGWDVSNVTDMNSMFFQSQFNGDISGWDVSNVKKMSWMFGSSTFNGDISRWNVSNVTDMSFMFIFSNFNRDISSWNISKVEDMNQMFRNSPFNRDLSSWDLSNKHCYYIFDGCNINRRYMPKIKK